MASTYPSARRPRAPLGGAIALVIPVVFIATAVRVGFGGSEDVATGYLATLLVGLAAPTAWLFAIDFIHASPLTVLFVSTVSSFPLWYLAGSLLADRSRTWRHFANGYTTLVLVYLALHFVVFIVADAVATS